MATKSLKIVIISIVVFSSLIFGMQTQAYAAPAALLNDTGVNPNTSVNTGEITVRTDKTSYNDGDTIIISGSTQDYISDTPVAIHIFNPKGDTIKVDQVDVKSDRTFSTSITATGSLWQEAGAYTVKAQYGSPDRTAQTTFQFAGSSTTQTGTTATANEIDIATGAGGSANAACVATNDCFTPNPFTVAPGTTVTWKNTDTAMHIVCSGKPSDDECGKIFEEDSLKPGKTFQFTFQNSGIYDYFCSVHPWMTGQIVVSGSVTSPPPQSPTLSITTDGSSYTQESMVTATAILGGTSYGQNVAISVIDPSGNIMISRVLSTNYQGVSSLQFKVPSTAQVGTYQVVATYSASGNNLKQTTQFTVNSQYAVSIVSVQSTDQQGNPTNSFARGGTGYVKVVLLGQSNQNGLTTINLFDSDSASIGIGSLKGSISNGQSEIVLSFPIPKDATVGTANIYADVFSDYPSRGGTPLTSEISSTVEIQ